MPTEHAFTNGAEPPPHAERVALNSANISNPKKLLRLPAVLERTGVSRAWVYAAIKARTFPAPVRLTGGRAVAWREEDIDRWIAGRVSVVVS